jgi:hypothetical protein
LSQPASIKLQRTMASNLCILGPGNMVRTASVMVTLVGIDR